MTGRTGSRIFNEDMQSQRQTLAQQQRLSLSPRLVQSIRLMALPYVDLREAILNEVDQNPALEVVSDPIEKTMIRDSDPFTDFPLSSAADADDESDEHKDFIEGALHRSQTLQEHLLEQIGVLKIDQQVRATAELIVQNLDNDGFLLAAPEELPGTGSSQIIGEALAVVRSLEPAGCATSGFHESLVVQAELLASEYAALHGVRDSILDASVLILRDHLDTLEKGRADAMLKALAKKGDTGIRLDKQQAESVMDVIRSLEPFPGRMFDHQPDTWIVPDVYVKRGDDGFTVTINDEEIPVIGISPFFMDLDSTGNVSGAPANAPDARDFARESIKEAKWFMHILSRRNLTLLKLVRALVVFQQDFFLYGPGRLAPLRMKDIAAEIGFHETTVSRAANGKYLQCDWGLFELRYFFTNSVGSAQRGYTAVPGGVSKQNNLHSQESVKEHIRRIIEASGSISDQKIADLLANRGIRIARRTVAKYRAQLDIKSSFDR